MTGRRCEATVLRVLAGCGAAFQALGPSFLPECLPRALVVGGWTLAAVSRFMSSSLFLRLDPLLHAVTFTRAAPPCRHFRSINIHQFKAYFEEIFTNPEKDTLGVEEVGRDQCFC